MPEFSATRTGYAHQARILLGDVPPAEVGAAVTTALCGHWGHDGPCRWPHHNAIEDEEGRADFLTVFVCPPDEESEVRSLVNAALAGDDRWTVLRSSGRDLRDDERELAERLATTPLP